MPRNKTYAFRFAVEGRGAFPLDMLRYDRCFPRSETDANIAQDHENIRTVRKVELTALERPSYWQPCEGRWESFGWRVVAVERVPEMP